MDFHFAFTSLMPVTMDFHCSLKPKGQSGPKHKQCSVRIAIDRLVTKNSGETVVPPLKLMHNKMLILFNHYLLALPIDSRRETEVHTRQGGTSAQADTIDGVPALLAV